MWFSQWAASALALAPSVMAGDSKYWQDNTDVKMLPVSSPLPQSISVARQTYPNTMHSCELIVWLRYDLAYRMRVQLA